MAKFTSPFESITGKYGNLIAYKVKDQNRLRSRPKIYHDANTPEQQKSRKRLTTITYFYSKLKNTPIVEIWRIGAIPTPHDRYSLFRKTNFNTFLPDGKIGDFSNLHLAVGTLPKALNMQIEIDEKDNITLSWDNHIKHTSNRDYDTLGVIAIHENQPFSPQILEGVSAIRKEEKAVFHVDRKSGKPLHLYVFFASPGKDAYSGDTYFELIFE